MSKKLSITAARNQLLELANTLKPGEEVQVYRHHRPVLRILGSSESETNFSENPFAILTAALEELASVPKKGVTAIARYYKKHLYGRKK